MTEGTGLSASTPAAAGYRMPPETAPHERTLMHWPCRRELWGPELEAAKVEYAGVANAIGAFEPVTLVATDAPAAAEARAATSDAVEVIEIPIDDSWARDTAPLFVTGGPQGRLGVHFRFNCWGELFPTWDRDEASGGVLAERFGPGVVDAPFVLEGGSICMDGQGRLVTTEQCLLHPNRNPELTRADLERGLADYLGATEVIWLGQGLVGDRDTDGHVDMLAAFTDDGSLLLASQPEGTADHQALVENRARAQAAGLVVTDFPLLAWGQVAGQETMLSYLNFYLCNGGVIVPLAGAPSDPEALERIGLAFPDRQVVGVDALTIAFGGGGPHCITQQVPLP